MAGTDSYLHHPKYPWNPETDSARITASLHNVGRLRVYVLKESVEAL